MGLKNSIAAFLLLLSGIAPASAQPADADKMAWFEDAKLGIFIHWGIYSVQGISESWAFFNNYISHENYLKQLDGFGAQSYRPQEWVDLIRQSGAKYAVITAKHHDGISLWDSKAPQALTTSKDAAAKRDVLSPFVQALKGSGLKTGIYFSLPDWSHPYYDVETRLRKRYALQQDAARWQNYIDYYQMQLRELSERYRPDLFWFDGDWEHTSDEWRSPQTLQLLRTYNPQVVVNSRLNQHGDYETPEQGIPVVKPSSRYWELCYTMNDSWGYQPFDKHYKTPNMIVRTLIDCIAMGGNLLLDIGPKADGSLAPEQVSILKELGRWTAKHQEAVYATRAGLDQQYLHEKTSLSKDGHTLFVYMDAVKDRFMLDGLLSKPKGVRILGYKSTVISSYENSRFEVSLPPDSFDPVATVLAITFDESPRFAKSSPLEKSALEAIYVQKDVRSTALAIARSTAAGDNLLAGKLSADGVFLPETLKPSNDALATWVSKHAEVLSFAERGIEAGHYAGYSALSKDRQTLYLFVEGKPTGPIAVKGLTNAIARIRVVGEGTMLTHQVFNKLYWSHVPGIVYVDVPPDRLDENLTVIAILLDKPIALYREPVGAIESNL